MVRLFERHKKRKSYVLEGMWRFKTDPDKIGAKNVWYSNFPSDAVDIVVPSCWNTELGLFEYEGLAWYAKKFTVTKKCINIILHGITGQSEVYLDGKHIGGHYGGWTGFNLVIKDLEIGEHSLVISVDNTPNDEDSIPLSKVDWFHYGGILRDIEIQELPDAWIKEYNIDYKLDDTLHSASIQFGAVLASNVEEPLQRTLNIYVNEALVASQPIIIKNENTIEIKDILLENIQLWDVENPNLYYINFEIEDDDVIERIGFRKITVKDKKILLNEKEIYLKGINRHDEHPDWGFAVPLKLLKKDVDIIKRMGCNIVRGSHYPNAPAFLDFLDQEGILFWEEIPMWTYSEKHFLNPVVVSRGLMMLEEMVKRDTNHPCIAIWGLHNEVDTTVQACRDATKRFAEKVKNLDPDRLITYASNHPMRDICFDLVDIISVNKYYGWYEGELEEWKFFIDDFKNKLKNEKLDDKPFVISEFGASGIYGDVTFEGPKWTENYQEKLLEYTLKHFYDDPNISGSFVWQFCDMRSSKKMELGRARSFNNKGIVNEYRKPKMAYWTVERIYNNIK